MNEAAQVTPTPFQSTPYQAPQQAEGINGLEHPMWEALILKNSYMEKIFFAYSFIFYLS